MKGWVDQIKKGACEVASSLTMGIVQHGYVVRLRRNGFRVRNSVRGSVVLCGLA